MPLTELSRNQLMQKRRELEHSSSFMPEPEKKPAKKKEKSIFAPDESDGDVDDNP